MVELVNTCSQTDVFYKPLFPGVKRKITITVEPEFGYTIESVRTQILLLGLPVPFTSKNYEGDTPEAKRIHDKYIHA